LLAGVASPEALCERAAELGYAALGLTDRDNLHLAVRFLNAARGCGLAPVIGAEVSALEDDTRTLARSSGLRAAQATRAATRARVLLIPFDRRGWTSLCTVLTARHLDDAFDLVGCVASHHAGLHVLAESPALAAALLAAGVPAAVSAADELARGLTRSGGRRASAGGLWLGVRGIAAERPRLRARLAESWRLGVPAVATGDVWMLAARDHEAHRVAVTADAGELLERMPASAFCAHDAWLRTPAEWEQRVRAVCGGAGCSEQAGALLENNAALVARCHLTLEMGTPIFPSAPLPEGVTGAERLHELAAAGLARRYPAEGVARAGAAAGTEARQRLRSELALIEHMGFTDYFLLVASIVGFARARGIPSVGRGSGASSIVAYALGVTSVDPVRYGLCFERFLHPQRRDCPDLDVDLCWRRRDEVIAHVYDTYGHDRVAMISTHATLGPRSAFREAAKALGVPLPRVNALARRVPRHLDASALEQALEHGATRTASSVAAARGPAANGETRAHERGAPGVAPRAAAGGADARERARTAGAESGTGPRVGPHDFGPEFAEPRIAEALRLAARLAGAPRHLSVHCGGLVIADRALTHYLPLERASKGVVVSQFEMRAVEAIGLVKMDLLGNRAITTIGECLALVGEGVAASVSVAAEVGTEGVCVQAESRGRAEPGTGVAGRTPSERSAGCAQRASACSHTPSVPADGTTFPHDRATPAPPRVINPGAITADDAIAAAAIAAGDTLNCFQLESPAMRHLLRMLQARTLDDTIAAVALVRPGPSESGMKAAFCRRRRGLEPVTYPHERLRDTLAGTQGILLYEEDVMRVAAALCGLPLAEGETLRRAIAHARGDEEFRFLERGFVAQALRAGISDTDAHAVWRELARFAGYAFCKAHAAGYGQLAWQSAALKARYPAEWAVGVLNHHAGMYPTWVHVEDLRRGGVGRAPVTFAAPCVERSGWNTMLDAFVPSGHDPCTGGMAESSRPARFSVAGGHAPKRVRVGLHRVAGLAHSTGERVVAMRPFASLADFVDRVRPTPPELDALILAGALDALGTAGSPRRTRAAMRLEARVHAALAQAAPGRVRRTANPRAAGLLLPDGAPLAPAAHAPRPGGDTLPELAELSLADLVRGEFAATGLWFAAHPLDTLVPPEALRGCTPASALEHHVGKRVTVCGIPCAARRVEARSGGIVLFTTLADHSGLVECVLFPGTYRRWGMHMRGEVVRAEGRVDETLGALTLVIERAASLGAGDHRAGLSARNDAGPPSTYRVA
jgi:DNA polymerase III alpha subunit